MDKSAQIVLLHETKQQNEKGEWVTTGTERRNRFAAMSNVSASEFFNAAQIGLNPELRFVMFAPDYDGETVLEYAGAKYSIYRTYRATTDKMELYAQREAGTA